MRGRSMIAPTFVMFFCHTVGAGIVPANFFDQLSLLIIPRHLSTKLMTEA